MLLNCGVGETFENHLDCKEIKSFHAKGNQSWIFIWRTDVEAEAPILWLPDPKSWYIRKDPAAGKDWGQEEKGTTEDGMVGWHHRLDWHEFEKAQGDSDGQGSVWYSACGCKSRTLLSNWTTTTTRCSWINSNDLNREKKMFKLLNVSAFLLNRWWLYWPFGLSGMRV